MTDQTTDFFDGIGSGAGAPTAVLKNVGDTVHGEIVEMFKRDYIPFGKTEPEKDDQGRTKQQLVVILQTNERNWANVVKVPKKDPSDANSPEKGPEEDDGKRAIYVPEGKNIQFAIGRAVQAAQAKFEVGGTLGVRIFNLKPTDKGNALKEHQAVYTAKPAPSAGDAFFAQQQQAPAQPAPQQAPPAPAPAPAAPAPQQQAPAPAPAAPAPAPAPAPASQDPWGAPAPAPAAGDPWATPAGGNQPPF